MNDLTTQILAAVIATAIVAFVAFVFLRPLLAGAYKGGAGREINEYAVRLVVFNYGFRTAQIPCTGHTALFPLKRGGGASAQVDVIAVEHPNDDPILVPPWGRVELGTLPFRARLTLTAEKGLENEDYFELKIRDKANTCFSVRFIMPESVTMAVPNADTGKWDYPEGSIRLSLAPYSYPSWWRKLQQRRALAHISHEDKIRQNWPRWPG